MRTVQYHAPWPTSSRTRRSVCGHCCDQRQHLEMARDLATRFSKAYGETFVVPRAVTAPVAARVMDLQDPAGEDEQISGTGRAWRLAIA